MNKMSWITLNCGTRDVQLLGTLNGGQSFRWKHDQETNEWTGVFSGTVWKLRECENEIQYKVLGTLHSAIQKDIPAKKKIKLDERSGNLHDMLKSYLRLDVDLSKYYQEWSEKDPLFKTAGKQFYGVRMLAQEPVENLFSFICSQNNHISRISSMVENLCKNYGELICSCDNIEYYSFPVVEKLADQQVEKKLRDLGFGYRAKFIQKSAEKIVQWGGLEWFHSLQKMEYKEAKTELIKLDGVGPKVADCICLMSLNHLESVPVDTHVYQIASQNYLKHLQGKKSVTDRMYNEIGDFFRDLYGPNAGWAHTILFCADLKKFQEEGTKKKKAKCS